MRIELNKHSQAILDKYKDFAFRGDLALPVISNVKMNEALKVLGQVCGIDEPTRIVYFQGNQRMEQVLPKWALLTTHCGRRTFVVTALQLGIPSEVIMKWTGHSNFSAMKPYVKIVDELKARAMTKISVHEFVHEFVAFSWHCVVFYNIAQIANSFVFNGAWYCVALCGLVGFRASLSAINLENQGFAN